MKRKVHLFESKKIPGAFNVGYLHERFAGGRCKSFYAVERFPRELSSELINFGVVAEDAQYSVLSKERDDLISYPEAHIKIPPYFSQGEIGRWSSETAYLLAKNFAEKIADNLDRELVDNTCFGNNRKMEDC